MSKKCNDLKKKTNCEDVDNNCDEYYDKNKLGKNGHD